MNKVSLRERINQDLKEFFKAGAADKVGILRLLNSALHNREIEKGKDVKLTEEDILQVLNREAKKRKEAIEVYEKGGRPELAEKEKFELNFLGNYLPAQMAKEEVVAEVEKILSGIGDKSNFGIVMKQVMAELKGKADAKLISDIIKEKLSG